MPKPYSDDLRERVIEAVVAGASRREAAESFSLSASSAVRWLQRWRDSGSTRAKLSGGSTSPLEEQVEWLLGLVAEQPDLTLDEIVAAMRKQRIPGSRTAVWRFFERHNVTVKKKACARASKNGRTWRGRGGAGFASKACLIPPDWCLSTRPPPAPAWCDFGAVARGANDWSGPFPTAIGRPSPWLSDCATTGWSHPS